MIRRWGIPALALLGVGVSGYLSYVKLTGGPIACFGGASGCDRVNASLYADVAGVPVAYLGLALYLALAALGWYAAAPRPHVAGALLAGWGLSLAGMLFSFYLTYVELAILFDICQWCVVSAVLITGIFALFSWRVATG